ncbi:MAG: LysR family transcriptional regulator [Rhodobacteraceae bacterium]|nr:LysR family transcriptional regulator [Paracoccaceae bacterium]
MDPADLALLLDVARTGSFAGAARARGVDPSSIGRTVAGIEADLGIRLFERTTRRMEMTEAGERYLARIAPLLEEIAQAGDEARDASAAPSGTLRLSASVTFGQRVIVPRLGAFRAAHPAIRVEGVFTDANVDLVADRIDLAVRLGPGVEGDLIVSKLMDTHYRVVAAPDYLAGAAPLERPEDMARHRAVLFPFRDFRSRWLFRDARGKVVEQPVDGELVLTPALALRGACLAGLGPALLPDWLIGDDVASGRLVRCLPEWEVTATTFDTAAWLVYPSRSYLPAKVRAMIDFLRDTTG